VVLLDDMVVCTAIEQRSAIQVLTPPTCLCRPTRWLFAIHFVAMAILTIIVVSLAHDTECDQTLMMWLVVWVSAQFVHIACGLWSYIVGRVSGYDVLADDFADGGPHIGARFGGLSLHALFTTSKFLTRHILYSRL
jgi:hypothetical protein